MNEFFCNCRKWPVPVQTMGVPQCIPAVHARSACSLDEANERPDTQIHFLPGAVRLVAGGKLVPVSGICASTCQLRPRSVGHVHISSAGSEGQPSIQLNLLQRPEDQFLAVRKLRTILAQAPIADFIGEEMEPLGGRLSDEGLLQGILQHSESGHHAVGSCRMGIDDKAVVTPELKVRGIDEGLRIADASIMPNIVSGNTHAPNVMIGEKLADLVLQRF